MSARMFVLILLVSLVVLGLVIFWAYSSRQEVISYDIQVEAVDLVFNGEEAFEYVKALATGFPNRHSGSVNNRLAAVWLMEEFREMGLEVYRDDFPTVLYSRPTPMTNVVGVKRGETEEAIVVVSHYDQATTTIQGADNGASGVGITLSLAELFSREDTYYTLIFLISDGEEYGMLGAKRFIDTYPNPEEVVTAISLDNIGGNKAYGLELIPVGQGKGYADLWLVGLFQQAAEETGLWQTYFPDWMTQIMERAILISFTDQGPFLTHGVPALGLGGFAEEWPHYHLPGDTIERISPDTLEQGGKLTEAVVRELNTRKEIPPAQQDYLYFDQEERSFFIPASPLAAANFVLILPLILAMAYQLNFFYRAGKNLKIPFLHALVNVLPPLAGLITLYLLDCTAIFPQFTFYPAPPLDPILYQPRWGGIVIFLMAIIIGALLARYLRQHYLEPAEPMGTKTAALLILTFVAVAAYIKNPYTVFFILPVVLLWPFLPGYFPRSKRKRIAAIVLFFAGGLFLYGGVYFFGVILQLGGYMLWYLMLMLSLRMVAPYTALAACLVIGSGLTLLGIGGGIENANWRLKNK